MKINPKKKKTILREIIKRSPKLVKDEKEKTAENKVYDSIMGRRNSGRDSHTIDELREKFRNIMESLKEKNMLTQEGRNLINQPRIKRDFKLDSSLVNDQGKRFLDRIYKRHNR